MTLSEMQGETTVRVTCSLVLYQSEPHQVRSCIHSILSSDLKVRLVVVDNSAQDQLCETASAAGGDYYFSGHNVGFGAGHNIAIRKLLGESDYHLVLNPDVRFGPKVLQALYQFMQRNPDVGLVMPRVLYPGGEEQGLCKLLPTPADLLIRRFGGPLGRTIFRAKMDRYLLRGVDLTTPRIVPSLSGCCMLIRTSLFQKVGLFDERYFLYMEDVDLCRRIGEVSKTMYFPEVSVYHEYQKGSYHSWLLTKHHIKSAWKYFRKWGWFVDRTRDQLNQSCFGPRDSSPIPSADPVTREL
jgi:GT2 family glycosyltransferase